MRRLLASTASSSCAASPVVFGDERLGEIDPSRIVFTLRDRQPQLLLGIGVALELAQHLP